MTKSSADFIRRNTAKTAESYRRRACAFGSLTATRRQFEKEHFVVGILPFVCFLDSIFYHILRLFQNGDVRTRYFLQKIRIFIFLPFIQYHGIDENSTKSLDFSILLRLTAHGRKRKTVNITVNFANLCKLYTQKWSVLHFGTDHLRYSVFCIFAESLFFDYSDADIEV